MEGKKKYTDIDYIKESDLKLIGSMLVFKLGKVINLFNFMNYDYNTGFFPFITDQKELDNIIEIIGEIFISSIISGDNADYTYNKDFPYKKLSKRDKKVGFSRGEVYNINIPNDYLIILGKVSLIYIANKTISYDFIDADKLIVTAYNKFCINKRELITVSSKIPRYSSDVMLTLVNSGLLKLVDQDS